MLDTIKLMANQQGENVELAFIQEAREAANATMKQMVHTVDGLIEEIERMNEKNMVSWKMRRTHI